MSWDDLQAWLETKEHAHHCTAFSEGQACCLNKREMVSTVLALLGAGPLSVVPASAAPSVTREPNDADAEIARPRPDKFRPRT